jgi:hypothetical protein
MTTEYFAFIAEEDYRAFRILVSTTLPRDYDMWLRVRERGKLRAATERANAVIEIEVTPEEFGAYCKRQVRRDFSIAALDACAREKGVAQGRGRALQSDCGGGSLAVIESATPIRLPPADHLALAEYLDSVEMTGRLKNLTQSLQRRGNETAA